MLGSLWQESAWWEESSGWMNRLGGGEPQRLGLVIFEPLSLAYAKTNHINFDRQWGGLTVNVCVYIYVCVGGTKTLQTTLPHCFYVQSDHLSVGYSITTKRDIHTHAAACSIVPMIACGFAHSAQSAQKTCRLCLPGVPFSFHCLLLAANKLTHIMFRRRECDPFCSETIQLSSNADCSTDTSPAYWRLISSNTWQVTASYSFNFDW